jgi:hypothetical protein
MVAASNRALKTESDAGRCREVASVTRDWDVHER